VKDIRTISTVATFDHLDSKLSGEKRLFFSRFGDVDFMMMQRENIGRTLGRSNKTLLTESLHEEMLESFLIEDKNYLRCHVSNMPFEDGMDILNLQGNHKAGEQAHKWWNEDVKEKSLSVLNNESKETTFYNACTFYMYATFRRELLKDFIFRNIFNKKKMFIGSRPKVAMEGLFGPIHHYVTTPEINSYSDINGWWPEVLNNIDDVDIVLPFTGQSSRVLNKRLWDMNVQVQSIDMGSWIDPYIGIVNRSWTRLAMPYITGEKSL